MSRPYFNVKQIYTGTGSLSSYTFDFKITKLEQLHIVVVDSNDVLVQDIRGTDTSFLIDVVFDSVLGGGTVNLQAALTSGYRMVLVLEDLAPTQDYEFRNKTSFTLRRFEDALDSVLGAVQGFVLKAKQSFRINDLDDENVFDGALPPGVADNGNKVVMINETGDGLRYGPTLDQVSSAAQAAIDAIAAAEIAEEASAQAQVILFDGEVTLTDTDSPVDFIPPTYNSKIVRIDASLGNVIINLQPLINYPEEFKAQFIRSDNVPANTVTIVPSGAETIDMATPYILPLGSAVIISKDLNNPNTNWTKKFIGVTSGGGSVPSGGVDGDYLEVSGGVLGFNSGIFEGFSARYGQALSLTTLRDALMYIFQFSYLAPLVSLTASGSTTVREKGTAVTASTLTAAVTKRSTDISRIQFFLGGVSVYDENPALTVGSGSTVYPWTGSFSDNSTFRVDVTDTTDGTNGPTTVQSSVNFTFVYPYYNGVGTPGLSAAAVAALTKDVRVSTASLAKTFTTASGEVFYFAYPASYGDLTSIKDINNFESISSWTKRTENITGLDANPVSYNIYEFSIPQGAGSTSFTFIR